MFRIRSINIKNLSFTYPGMTTAAIIDISLDWKAGEVVGLVGLSASGKSTLGRLLKGLIKPEAGRIEFLNLKSESRFADQKDCLRRIGWVGAHPEIQIFASTVQEEVGFGPANIGVKGKELDERIASALSKVGLEPEKYLTRFPLMLSGGEKRRVAIASIISMDYKFYIFDEPTAGLDPKGCAQFKSLVRQLASDGCGILWITHNLKLLKDSIDRLLVLDGGKIVSDSKRTDINWEELRSCLIAGK